MGPFGGPGQKLGSSILNHLQAVYGCLAKAGEKGVAVIVMGGNKPMYDHFQLSSGHNGPEFSEYFLVDKNRCEPNNLDVGQDSRPGPEHQDYGG